MLKIIKNDLSKVFNFVDYFNPCHGKYKIYFQKEINYEIKNVIEAHVYNRVWYHLDNQFTVEQMIRKMFERDSLFT